MARDIATPTTSEETEHMHGTPCMVTRKPWAAGLLSGLMPGLGQLYNGQPAKAFLLAVFAFFISGLLGTGLIVYVP